MRHFQQIPRYWLPPHCPNPKCKCHKKFPARSDFKKAGFYTTLANPQRIQRFTCKHCRRSFSRQTFSTTYWQKRPDIDRQLFMKAVGCMANRQISRDLGIAPETVNRHVARLGRHCLLFHWRMIQDSVSTDDIVVDGFESFEYSQYHPFHHQVAVEKSTGFFSYFTDSELRRKGRMTRHQKRRREELEEQLGRPDPKAIEKDMAEVLQVVLKDRSSATVYSDEHWAYPRSLGRVLCQVEHRVTNSKEHRNAQNPLFEVNLLDLLIRHGSSNHKRETIAWSKRRQCSAERLAILLVWRNYVKLRGEKRCRTTPAMERGLLSRRLSVDDVLSERIFRSQVELPSRWADYYDKRVRTRALQRNRTHDLSYAA